MKTVFVCLLSLMPFIASAKKFNAEVISYETHVSMKGDVRTITELYKIQINNSAGEKYANIDIQYDKSDKLTNIKAYIIDKRGKVVRKLKNKDISRTYLGDDNALYQDTYDANFLLNYDDYPYTLVYSYQKKTENPLVIVSWNPLRSRKIPTLQAILTIEVPNGYKIAYRDWKTDTLIKEADDDNMVKYTWKAHYTDILEPEQFAPPLYKFIPFVVMVPQRFRYFGIGFMKSWKSYGNWQDSVTRPLSKLPVDEQQRIQSLLKGVKGKMNKIRVLYHYLQDETRYVDVTIKTGRMIPHSASYVADNKYGDCKALSNYMKAMLDYVGIKSDLANIEAGSAIDSIDRNFPSPQFNHMILYVPDSTKPLWLDCTSKYALGWLGTFTQGRYAMVVEKNHSRLIRTPSLTPKQVEEFRSIDVSYNLEGKVLVKFHNTYRGDMYEFVEELIHRADPMYKQKYIRKYLVDDGIALMSDSIPLLNRDSTAAQFFYTGSSGQIYSQYGNDILVQNIPFDVPDIETPKDRMLPVQISAPIYRVDSINYEIPPGYRISAKLKDTVLVTPFGKYSHRSYQKDNSVYVTNRLMIYAGKYPLKVYNQLYQFLKDADKSENATVCAFTKNTP